MSEKQLYRYTIPLNQDGDGKEPVYDPDFTGTIVVNKCGANEYVLVKDKSTPHYHKDSINVNVEEVDAEDYDYEPTEDTTEEPEEGGEE